MCVRVCACVRARVLACAVALLIICVAWDTQTDNCSHTISSIHLLQLHDIYCYIMFQSPVRCMLSAVCCMLCAVC